MSIGKGAIQHLSEEYNTVKAEADAIIRKKGRVNALDKELFGRYMGILRGFQVAAYSLGYDFKHEIVDGRCIYKMVKLPEGGKFIHA